jgi:preprotein translocase subunit SecB
MTVGTLDEPLATPAATPSAMKLYPIQANFIVVRELYLKANVLPSEQIEMEEGNLTFRTGHGTYDPEKHVIDVGAFVETNDELGGEEGPFSLRVHLLGQFAVDESNFPKDKVEHWARMNAPFILFPYLREHVFALTARCGFKPVLLPLVELPTFKLEAKLTEKKKVPEEG